MGSRSEHIVAMQTLLLESNDVDWNEIASEELRNLTTKDVAECDEADEKLLFELVSDQLLLHHLPVPTLSFLIDKFPKTADVQDVWYSMQEDKPRDAEERENWNDAEFINELDMLAQLPDGSAIAAGESIRRGFKKYDCAFEDWAQGLLESPEDHFHFDSYDCLALVHVAGYSTAYQNIKEVRDYLIVCAGARKLQMAFAKAAVQCSNYSVSIARKVFPRTMQYLEIKHTQHIAHMVATKVAGHELPVELVDSISKYMYEEDIIVGAEGKFGDFWKIKEHMCDEENPQCIVEVVLGHADLMKLKQY